MPDTIDVLDALGVSRTVKTNDYLAARIDLLTVAVAANTAVLEEMRDNPDPVVISGTVGITDITNAEYEPIAAGQTDVVLGASGLAGDFLLAVVVFPADTSIGAVVIKDNNTTIASFAGGTLTDTKPIVIPVQAKSTGGAWKVTTGTDAPVVCIGNFT